MGRAKPGLRDWLRRGLSAKLLEQPPAAGVFHIEQFSSWALSCPRWNKTVWYLPMHPPTTAEYADAEFALLVLMRDYLCRGDMD